MRKNRSGFGSIMFVIIFVMSISVSYVYASDTDVKGSQIPNEKNMLDSYDRDILDEKDEDLFADFDKIIEEDLDTLFDEISTSEDIEEEEISPELFSDEIVDDTMGEQSILKEEDTTGLIKD